jgi:hypothetical protein
MQNGSQTFQGIKNRHVDNGWNNIARESNWDKTCL